MNTDDRDPTLPDDLETRLRTHLAQQYGTPPTAGEVWQAIADHLAVPGSPSHLPFIGSRGAWRLRLRFATLALAMLMLAGLGLLTDYYAHLETRLARHETLVFG